MSTTITNDRLLQRSNLRHISLLESVFLSSRIVILIATVLHCRLKTARKCALQISKGPAFRSKSEQEQEDAISNMDEHAVQVHNKFMTLVSDLIDGTQDSSVYEDACRHLLGTSICSTLQFFLGKAFGMRGNASRGHFCTRNQ